MTSPLIYRQLTQGTGNSGVLGAGDEAGFFSDSGTLQEAKNTDVPRSITMADVSFDTRRNSRVQKM